LESSLLLGSHSQKCYHTLDLCESQGGHGYGGKEALSRSAYTNASRL
jgi:hypothetical protein